MQPNFTHSNTIDFKQAFMVWLKIGLLSFGGPAGQIAMMHKILVEDKGWIDEERFIHALNYCMLLPGPEAQQLSIYLGWLLHRVKGGITAGVLFVLPGAITVLVLSIIYALFQHHELLDAIFFGIKAAIIAIVVDAMLRMAKKVLKNKSLIIIAIMAFIGLFVFNLPYPLIIIAAGIIGFVINKYATENNNPDNQRRNESSPTLAVSQRNTRKNEMKQARPTATRAVKIILICFTLWFSPLLICYYFLGASNVYTVEGVFFSKMAVVTFGGAYAVLAYMAQQAVNVYGWLAPGEMLDGLGMAETTPGPLIMVVQFVGFMGAYRNPGLLDPILAGTIGAALTTWVTFVPCFLWIFLGAPYIETLRHYKSLNAALSAITAAVVGVIFNLALWFSMHVLFDDVIEKKFNTLTLLLPDLASINLSACFMTITAIVLLFIAKFSMLRTLLLSSLLGVFVYNLF